VQPGAWELKYVLYLCTPNFIGEIILPFFKTVKQGK